MIRNITFIILTTILLFACKQNRNLSRVSGDCINEKKSTNTDQCDYTFMPVCGCDQLTYRNDCFAKSAGVLSWTDGPCEGDCIDKNVILADEICTREYRPVCGCNDVTYSNPCVARKSGILSYTPGKCGEATDR